MRAQATFARGRTAALMVGAAVMGFISESHADGDEMLGFIDVADGSNVIMAGVGLFDGQPGSIDTMIPAGVSIEQVLLYWNGIAFGRTEQGEMDTIMVDGGAVTGDRIGGPDFFFGGGWSSTYRAELSTSTLSTGANSLAISGLDFGTANNGAGLLVIVDDGVGTSDIQVADGDDTAFSGFPPPRDATVPVVYSFAPAGVDRVADLSCFTAGVASSSAVCRPNVLRILVGKILVEEIENPFGSGDGPEWDTFTTTVNVPAGAMSVTVQAVSDNLGNECPPDDPGTGTDASMVWIASALALPEVETGACCLIGGACEDGLTAPECFAIAGLYQGDGTTCADVECPAFPPGACCLPDGSCQDDLMPGECLALGGVHQGPDSTCDTTDCDDPGVGACCLVGPECVEVTAAECAAAPGLFFGVGSSCDKIECPQFPSGACCLPDGTCEELAFFQCVLAGGLFLGPDTLCVDVECPPVPTGACCLAGASCADVSPAECLAVGGDFQGLGTDCATVDCPCVEDLDDDGMVGFSDLTDLLSAWGPCPDPPMECPADFNGNGDVGFEDLTRLLAAWGPCPDGD